MKFITKMDILAFGTTILMLITRAATTIYLSLISQATKVTIERVVTVYEANPLAKLLLSLSGVSSILSVLVLPGLVFTVYIILRRLCKKGVVSEEALMFYDILLFTVMVLNVLNDCILAIGKYVSLNR